MRIGGGPIGKTTYAYDFHGRQYQATDTTVDYQYKPSGRLYQRYWERGVTTLTGTGTSAFSGDGGPAANAQIAYPMAVALAPDGVLYFADHHAARIRKIYSRLPGSGLGELLIPSEDGSVVYHFSSVGRHLRTLHALTGATLHEFGYTAGGQLRRITDVDGQVTTIERTSRAWGPASRRGHTRSLRVSRRSCSS